MVAPARPTSACVAVHLSVVVSFANFAFLFRRPSIRYCNRSDLSGVKSGRTLVEVLSRTRYLPFVVKDAIGDALALRCRGCPAFDHLVAG